MVKKKSILLIVFVLLIGLFISPKSVIADENKYKLEINYGIEGNHKSGRYIPFKVKITPEEDFVGEVEIRVKTNEGNAVYDAFSKEISVEASKSSEVIIPVTIQEGHGSVQVNLINEEGKVKAKKDVNVSSGRINEYSLAVGLLTEDKTSLGYVSSVMIKDLNGNSNNVKSIALSTEYLDELGLAIDTLDVIIISNFNMASLTESNYKSLKSWVEKGGNLLISAGANEGKTIKNIDKSFLNVSSSGLKEENVNILGKSLNIINSNITLENSNDIIIEGSSKPLAYYSSKGRGKVIVTTFDLGLEPFISSGIEVDLIENILESTVKLEDNNYKYRGGFYEIDNLVKSIPVGKLTDTKVITTIILFYAVIVGFVVYIVLKKINKRDLTWIVIPALALIFSGIIYIFGNTINFEEVILNKSNIIKIDQNGLGNLTGYVGISSKKKENIEIESESDVINLLNEDYYYGNSTDTTYKSLSLKTSYKEDKVKYTIGKEKSLSTTGISIEAGEIIIDKFDNDLRIKENGLNGKIKNNLSYKMENVLVVSNNTVWNIGSLEVGEEKEIVDLKAVYYLGLNEYTYNDFQQKYNDARYNGSGNKLAKEYENILLKANFIRTAGSNGFITNKPQIIAISKMPVEYDIDLNVRSTSEFNMTLIVQDIALDFKDENGVYNYPAGYFEPEHFYDNTKAINYDYYGNAFYSYDGKQEVELYYFLDKNIKFEEVAFNVANTHGYTSGEGAILNIKTNEYEDVIFSDKKMTLENLESYLDEDNKITVKLYLEDTKNGNEVPLISAKGRDK